MVHPCLQHLWPHLADNLQQSNETYRIRHSSSHLKAPEAHPCLRQPLHHQRVRAPPHRYDHVGESGAVHGGSQACQIELGAAPAKTGRQVKGFNHERALSTSDVFATSIARLNSETMRVRAALPSSES